MNEKLFNLIKRSGFVENTPDIVLVDIYKKELEKFAQLIIEECAYAARQCKSVRAVDAEDVAQHIEEWWKS